MPRRRGLACPRSAGRPRPAPERRCSSTGRIRPRARPRDRGECVSRRDRRGAASRRDPLRSQRLSPRDRVVPAGARGQRTPAQATAIELTETTLGRHRGAITVAVLDPTLDDASRVDALRPLDWAGQPGPAIRWRGWPTSPPIRGTPGTVRGCGPRCSGACLACLLRTLHGRRWRWPMTRIPSLPRQRHGCSGDDRDEHSGVVDHDPWAVSDDRRQPGPRRGQDGVREGPWLSFGTSAADYERYRPGLSRRPGRRRSSTMPTDRCGRPSRSAQGRARRPECSRPPASACSRPTPMPPCSPSCAGTCRRRCGRCRRRSRISTASGPTTWCSLPRRCTGRTQRVAGRGWHPCSMHDGGWRRSAVRSVSPTRPWLRR